MRRPRLPRPSATATICPRSAWVGPPAVPGPRRSARGRTFRARRRQQRPPRGRSPRSSRSYGDPASAARHRENCPQYRSSHFLLAEFLLGAGVSDRRLRMSTSTSNPGGGSLIVGSLFDRDRSAERLPVSLITGFLRSGKTTLLNRLLQPPAMSG